MKKDDLKVQKAYKNTTNIIKSENDCCADSDHGEKVSDDQNFYEKIGVRNPHPWNLIGLR